VVCDPDEHHHHLVCSNCGRSEDVADGELARLVDEIGRRHGYRIETHRLELFGICPLCAAATEARTREVAHEPAPGRTGAGWMGLSLALLLAPVGCESSTGTSDGKIDAVAGENFYGDLVPGSAATSFRSPAS
jgi:hypothetical protein